MDSDIAAYVQRLHGTDHENAYFALIELDHSLVPDLIEAYRAEPSLRIKALLIEIISEYRLPRSLDFLAESLQDANEEIWKTSLDGIVKINDRSGLDILDKEKQRLIVGKSADNTRVEWVEEAIRQLDENAAGG